MRIAVLSDTHAPRRWQGCPHGVARHLRDVDLILHAGDVCIPEVLDELATFATVYAVAGNNDRAGVSAWGAPHTLQLAPEDVRIAVVHDAGPSKGRSARLHRSFPGAQLVVFGHSHIPLYETDGRVPILNPGSPTDRRRQPHGTIALLDVAAGQLREARIIPVT